MCSRHNKQPFSGADQGFLEKGVHICTFIKVCMWGFALLIYIYFIFIGYFFKEKKTGGVGVQETSLIFKSFSPGLTQYCTNASVLSSGPICRIRR